MNALASTSFAPRAITSASPKTRLRITRRGRAVLTAMVAAPVIAVALVIALNGGGAFAAAGSGQADASGVEFEYVTIQAGQSMWQVAETIAPASDPRDVIADIVSLNQLDTASVFPGQQLAVPATYSN